MTDDVKRTQSSSLLGFPLVSIGASAGSVGALQHFFASLPPNLGAAFIVIVHLDPTVRSELPQILAARTTMPVRQVIGTARLERDCVYVIPPDRQLKISDHEITATPFVEPRGLRAPIDAFFRSHAEHGGEGFAVVLTGSGSDGAQGAKAVKAAGGIVLVQDPTEAEFPSMPRSVIETEAADFVLPIRDLAKQLAELLSLKRQVASPHSSDQEEQLRRILAHLRVRTGHDFSHYKRSTVIRRITRRMQVARKEAYEDYVGYLRESTEESQALLADLLISVTTFFRDSKSFDTLARIAIPRLFEGREDGFPIRVWVPGCATGEEAYSLAILLLEEAARHELRPEIQLFASDMDARALVFAREGCYPQTIEADVSEDRLRRFFTRDGEQYRVKRDLRDIVLFTNHSLLRDPPFSRLDLISCRNLLIYLDRELQQQVLMTLHYGLTPTGYLFLGSSEAAEHSDNLFYPVDREIRLYQSTGRIPDKLPNLPRFSRATVAIETTPVLSLSGRATQTAHREALEAFAPPSILVDDMLHALHLSETAGRYLMPSGGPVTTDVTDLVRPELRFELRTALHRVFERNEPVLSPATMVRFNGDTKRVYIHVKPAQSAEQDGKPRRAVVFFFEGRAEVADKSDRGASGDSETTSENFRELKQELELTQARLRTTREESEAANEELRAANEELQSINEEYRSTAEELETSKEELQSINEELQTVNSELKLKLETVSRANSDLQNLMAATDFATLFLDAGLRIKRFTPRITELFSITPNDIGRPITDFTHQLDYEGIPSDTREVLDNLAPIEREIRSRKGDWYLVRFRPYRTVDDKIDGVVATFINVTERRQMEDALRKSEELLRQESRLVELSRAPIFVWEFEGKIRQWNRGSEELYGYSKEEALGRTKWELLKTTVPGTSFETVRQALLENGVWRGELNHVSKDGHQLTVESHIVLMDVNGQRVVLESTRDITQAKALDSSQRLLLRELAHRVKNTLTVVLSMVQQTQRTTANHEEFVHALSGRITALENSHKSLVNAEWTGADLLELIQDQLAAYVENSDRLLLSGPAVKLPSDVATPLGLILHELATNAVKYGALSGTAGDVALDWNVTIGNKGPVLTVVWQERNGPAVTKSTEGFGTRLIKAGMPGAVVRHEFASEGVRCVIEIPLKESLAS